MRDLATRPHRAEIAAGRIDLRLGTADRSGFCDAEFDCVVSVNNVAIWPDLEAGLRELHRVTRPGGRVLIAWHGGTRPSRIARCLALPEDKLARIERGLRGLFSGVTRQELAALTVFAPSKHIRQRLPGRFDGCPGSWSGLVYVCVVQPLKEVVEVLAVVVVQRTKEVVLA
jgi:SAM-dependent methyltransferase